MAKTPQNRPTVKLLNATATAKLKVEHFQEQDIVNAMGGYWEIAYRESRRNNKSVVVALIPHFNPTKAAKRVIAYAFEGDSLTVLLAAHLFAATLSAYDVALEFEFNDYKAKTDRSDDARQLAARTHMGNVLSLAAQAVHTVTLNRKTMRF